MVLVHPQFYIQVIGICRFLSPLLYHTCAFSYTLCFLPCLLQSPCPPFFYFSFFPLWVLCSLPFKLFLRKGWCHAELLMINDPPFLPLYIGSKGLIAIVVYMQLCKYSLQSSILMLILHCITSMKDTGYNQCTTASTFSLMYPNVFCLCLCTFYTLDKNL